VSAHLATNFYTFFVLVRLAVFHYISSLKLLSDGNLELSRQDFVVQYFVLVCFKDVLLDSVAADV